MAKQKYLWIVERKIGSWASWVAKGKRGPKPNENGTMRFGKGDYAVDPNKFRNWTVPRKLKAGETVKIQIWAEDNKTPQDFFIPEKKVGDEFTASLLQNIAKTKRLELSRANRETDKIVIILAIALMVAMGAISVLAYLVVNKLH